MNGFLKDRRVRMAVSVAALMSLNVQPVLAQGKGRDAVLNACATERDGLIRLDKEYDDLKRSKMSAAIGEGFKQGATVLAKGVMNGGLAGFGRGGGGGGFGGGGFGGVGGLMSAVGGMAAQQAAAPSGPAPASASAAVFGQDMLSGAMGLNVPGISNVGFSGGDSMKGYAALAVLVAIVATAEAYAQLKEQEAGGDLRKASYNIDQDAARQLTVARQIANDGGALVECRTRQVADVESRLASAANDKDRKAIRRERTELIGALKKDVDLTGEVVEQHTGMAKTFTQGRAMTDGASEADVLGGQTPAYATAASVTRLSMPKAGAAPAGGGQAQAAAPAAPASAMVAIRATVIRTAPVASAAALMNLPVGREVKPKSAQADGGWWEVDVAGQSGYVRAADLGPPGSAPAPVQTAAKARGGKATPPPPKAAPAAPAGPSNIRAYNQQVIAARDTGKGRLSSLMTDIQTSQRRESVLYAWLERVGLG